MGPIIAVKTRSNMELKAKEMLTQVLENEIEEQISNVYALETFTEVVSDDTTQLSNALTRQDVKNNQEKQEIGSQLSNLREQLNSTSCKEKRKNIRSQIKDLEQKRKNFGNKRVECVLKGYILVELREGVEALCNRTHALIKNIPLIQYVLSPLPIPQEEMDSFAQIVEEELEPQIEMKETPSEDRPASILSRLKDVAKKRTRHFTSEVVMLFRKGKKEYLRMPLKTFQQICGSLGFENTGYHFSFDGFLNLFFKGENKKWKDGKSRPMLAH